MPFVSVTRLRLRSARFLPAFVIHNIRTLAQVKAPPGFRGGSLLADRALAPHHADLGFRAARTSRSAPLRPKPAG